jgi:hypothetical protein
MQHAVELDDEWRTEAATREISSRRARRSLSFGAPNR